MSRSKTLLLAVALLSVLTACNRRTVYSHYEHTPLYGWEKNDTLDFTVGRLAADGIYREEVGLRINGAYPFMGLCLIVEQETLPAGIWRTDTLNCSLIARDGTAKGRGVSYYQYTFHLTDRSLLAGDSLHVSIRHNMKREMLPGIADIGFSLTKE